MAFYIPEYGEDLETVSRTITVDRTFTPVSLGTGPYGVSLSFDYRDGVYKINGEAIGDPIPQNENWTPVATLSVLWTFSAVTDYGSNGLVNVVELYGSDGSNVDTAAALVDGGASYTDEGGIEPQKFRLGASSWSTFDPPGLSIAGSPYTAGFVYDPPAGYFDPSDAPIDNPLVHEDPSHFYWLTYGAHFFALDAVSIGATVEVHEVAVEYQRRSVYLRRRGSGPHIGLRR